MHLVAIAAIYEWALDDWDQVIPRRAPLVRTTAYDLEVTSGSAAKVGQEHQLRPKYLILGLLHLLDQMGKFDAYRTASAALMMFDTPVGFIRLGRLPKSRSNDALPLISATDSAYARIDQRPNLLASRRIIDPKDSDFVIEYRLDGRPIPCVDVLATFLYAMATAAQGSIGDYCRDLGGWNEKRSAMYRIHGLKHTKWMALLSYGLVRRGLSLLPSRLVAQGTCGTEVSWTFLYQGDVLGFGSIEESDWPASTAR